MTLTKVFHRSHIRNITIKIISIEVIYNDQNKYKLIIHMYTWSKLLKTSLEKLKSPFGLNFSCTDWKIMRK